MPQAIIVFFQLYFLTDIAGLRPDYAAWSIAAGRLWDAINDPLFGVISDRIHQPDFWLSFAHAARSSRPCDPLVCQHHPCGFDPGLGLVRLGLFHHP